MLALPSDYSSQAYSAVLRFSRWLEGYGELSHDHQSFFASDFGRWTKALYYKHHLLGTAVVAPVIMCEAFLPAVRTIFWKPQRFPIADAHYAMGYAFLFEVSREEHYYKRAVHFLEVLEQTRCPGFEGFCWGYPFHWETSGGTISSGTPLITTLPYAYEAFAHVYRLDAHPRWNQIMLSIAEHALSAYRDTETGQDAASCAYTPAPNDPAGVINASAYRSFLLTKASVDFADDRYRRAANRNLNFVLDAQKPDGSWPYSIDGKRDFVDHFHTCFVLKALAKIEQLTRDSRCAIAIARGVNYYVKNLFDDNRLPKPFSKRPRLTVYRRELYDYAECLNLSTLLAGRFPELDQRGLEVVSDILRRWQNLDGSFRARQLLLGWDNVPMHRWAQSQVFRSLSFLLAESRLREKKA
jgi:hypothetical protein